jgi:hypothetical protein
VVGVCASCRLEKARHGSVRLHTLIGSTPSPRSLSPGKKAASCMRPGWPAFTNHRIPFPFLSFLHPTLFSHSTLCLPFFFEHPHYCAFTLLCGLPSISTAFQLVEYRSVIPLNPTQRFYFKLLHSFIARCALLFNDSLLSFIITFFRFLFVGSFRLRLQFCRNLLLLSEYHTLD